jgi:hypothetical protein
MFAMLAAMFPRVGLAIIWIFTDWVEIAFDNWLTPLLGLIFLPFATLMYILVDVSSIGDIGFGGWLLVGLGALFDVMHWAQVISNRRNGVDLYNQYAPGRATGDLAP